MAGQPDNRKVSIALPSETASAGQAQRLKSPLTKLAGGAGGDGATAAGAGPGSADVPASRPRRQSRKSLTQPGSSGGGGSSSGGGMGSRRGSSMALAAMDAADAASAAAAGEPDPLPPPRSGGAPAAPAMHPGLDRIKSFNRKKSAFRTGSMGGPGGAAKGVHFGDLAVAMDVLDERIGGALQQVRRANAAGLGRVRGLGHSRSGRLQASSGKHSSTGSLAALAEEGEAEDEGGELPAGQASAGGEEQEEEEAFGAAPPGKLPSSLKSELSEPASRHEGGFITARGRLEGNTDAVVLATSLIPAKRASGAEPAASDVAAAAGDGLPSPEQQPPGPGKQPAEAQPDGQKLEPEQPDAAQSDPQQQQQRASASPQPSRPATAVRGASTEGVMDRVGWVRNLVQFGEYKQRQQAQQAPQQAQQERPAGDSAAAAPAGQQPALDTIGWLEAGAGLKPGMLPPGASAAGPGGAAAAGMQVSRVAPRSREEVSLLQAWLRDMMSQVISQGQIPGQAAPAPTAWAAADGDPGSAAPADPASAASTLADAALWVYGMAFEELQRQVATECSDRGALLGGMWQHVFNLVELRCSLVYENIIGAIKEELQAARRRADKAAAAARAAEARVQESLYYSRDKFAAMEGEVKHLSQLLATADDETSRHSEEAALLRKAIDGQTALREAAEERAAQEHRRRLDLEHRVEEMEEAAAEQAAARQAQQAELAQLRGDLQHVRGEALALGEDKARLEVEVSRLMRDFQTSEIMALGLREQLAARDHELSELSSRHAALQQEQAQVNAALLQSQASLSGLQVQHESLQTSAADRLARLEAELAEERSSLADVRRELGETQQERSALQRAVQEAEARETALTAQLKQLAGAHEQQTSKLRQETEARRNGDDELQALRAGLQVTQQRLEGLGLVFASGTAHRTSAEVWKAIGPLSMARQVVAAVNQQLGELAARKAELQHELGVAKERWQTEESVRVRLQEQLLESKARESKLGKEREGLEGIVARLQAANTTLDAEAAQMRRMLAEAESRCQASHKKAMEAASEAKRLAPLEPQVARLQDAAGAAHAELDRAQREITSHQASIRKLLDEKGTALEQLAARNQALDAAQLQIRELGAASRDRLELAEAKNKLEEQLHELRQRCSATERLQGESMHQLMVARRLLADAANADDRARLAATEQQLESSKAVAAATRRESMLLKDRLTATQGQLQFMERQLHVAVNSPLAAAMAAAGGGGGGGGAAAGAFGGVAPAVVEQLKRLLETKEGRIKQLEGLQSLLAATTAQLKHVKEELGDRDGQVAALKGEVEATRKRLHALQEAQAKAATKDLIALAASNPAIPPEIAQSLALDYARNHLRSELAWTKAKLVVVSHMASGLRAKLQAAEAARAQAELESVCVEAFYLEQGLMDQRATAAAFDATFVQVKRALVTALAALAELRRLLVAPAAADLPRLASQASMLTAALGSWLQRFESRRDESCQVDPLAELADWQHRILEALPAIRPASPPPLHHVSAIIVQLYAHRVKQLPLGGPPEDGPLLDSVFEAAAEFFCERRGFNRGAALSPTGPVAALLAGAKHYLQQPKQLLLGRLAGLVPGGASGSSRSLQHPAAWQFFVRLLCCLRALLGAGWDALVKEWAESEEGVALPLPAVMDVLANLHNTDAPALLDSMRRGLVPLVRQGRRGPAVDLDAFLLVCMNEYSDGNCPVDPLSLPRRLTDGALSSGALPASSLSTGSGTSGPMAALAGTVAGVAAAVGQDAAAEARQQQQQQQRSPMRKRIVNLTVASESLPLVGGGAGSAGLGGTGGSGRPRSPPLRSATASPDPTASQQYAPSGSGSPGVGSAAAGAAAGAGAGAGWSLHVLSGMNSLMASNPALPVGLRSSLRASAPNAPPSAAAGRPAGAAPDK